MSGNDENDHVRRSTTVVVDDDDNDVSINNNGNATVDNKQKKVNDVKLSSQNGANKTGASNGSSDDDDELHNKLEMNNENADHHHHHVESAPPKPAKRLSKKTEWVQFDDEDKMTVISMPSSIQQENNNNNNNTSETSTINATDNNIAAPPAVLTTESVHVNIAAKSKSKVQNPINASTPKTSTVIDFQKMSPTNNPTTTTSSTIQTTSTAHPSNTANTHIQSTTDNNSTISTITTSPITTSVHQTFGLRTIELSSGRIREGFVNGDIIVTLLPVNTKWPWITPAIFRPELVPEELMAQGLTLTVEEYVHAMETLVNDVRFTFYNVCYKRVLVCWILFAFCVLIGLLFSGLNGIALFSLGVAWLFLNAAALFFCMWIKLRLSRGLERCMASVNKQLLRHKIILALDDRGKISCHKVNLCFLYYDPGQCVAFLNEFIERNEQNGTSIEPGWESRLDVAVNDIVIQGSNTTRVSRKQAVGEELFLRYLQRWSKDFLRRRLDWIVEENGMHESPRHIQSSMCPCQYTEEILHNKPPRGGGDTRACCATINNWCNNRGFKLC